MKTRGSKKHIDHLRDGALTMQIGDKQDGAIKLSVNVAEIDFYIVKERAIYRVVLADQTDPERTNLDVPNGNQRIVSAGASSEIVCCSFLTANALMNVDRFDRSKNRKQIMDLSLEVMNKLLAAEKIQNDYLAAELAALEEMQPPKKGSFAIPSVDGLPEQVNAYIQKIEHAAQSAYRLTQLFYGHRKKMFEGFAGEVAAHYGEEDEFSKFARNFAMFMVFVRNIRNCIEHPKTHEQLLIKNFALDAKNLLSIPSIEVVHGETPYSETPLGCFLQELLEGFSERFEILLAYLASYHLASAGGFEVAIDFIPEERRMKGVNIKYGYFANLGNGWNPIR